MATYTQFKKITTENIPENSISLNRFAAGAGSNYGILWVYHPRGLCCQACLAAGDDCTAALGFCCLWTVPAGVSQAQFELWGGGGSGAGTSCCNGALKASGGQGGNYASDTIAVCPGWTYTICAGGTYPCRYIRTCCGGPGCASFVIGCNLSNLCALGGCSGYACVASQIAIGGTFQPCLGHSSGGCGWYGADFGIYGGTGGHGGSAAQDCRHRSSWSGAAPMIGLTRLGWMSENGCNCGCYVNWPAGGGSSPQSQCQNFCMCCAAGTMGGSGLVKVTYI